MKNITKTQGYSKILLQTVGTDSSFLNKVDGGKEKVHTHMFANADQFHSLHVRRLQSFGSLFVGLLTQLVYTPNVPVEGLYHKQIVLDGPVDKSPKD